eukprot:gb/GECG01010668.1/.p1 GENE.gb/GECG01010668.1/~~gb/GECG01010668.1/.p1  ORF type:complete len:162 (+),score=12.24 gb/GECG01010668.1/:1-486(+)
MAAGGRHIYRLPLWELGYQGGPGWTRKDEADNHTSRLSKASAATQEGEEPQTIAQQIKDRSKRPHAKWLEFHPLQSYYCCDGCGLLLHEKIPGCTLHAVESRFCPQCGTFYSPQQASEQKGRYVFQRTSNQNSIRHTACMQMFQMFPLSYVLCFAAFSFQE